MRRHSLGALLFALAGSCGAPAGGASEPVQPHSKTARKPITPDLQKTLDGCASNQDTQCGLLCMEVFELGPDSSHILQDCKFAVAGRDVAVTVDLVPRPPPPPPGYSSNPQGCAPGRRPIGMQCVPIDAPSEIAAYLADAAQLEAASVTAFVRIHRHLVELGAPRELLARVAEAAADELEHTRLVVALARAYGASPRPSVIDPEPPLALVERAIDNVVAGIVGETIAALHAAFIATRATDPAVRAVFAQIVEDEARHALLARSLHRFYAARLSRRERRVVDAAYRLAADTAIATPPSTAMCELGIPQRSQLAEAGRLALAATAVRAQRV